MFYNLVQSEVTRMLKQNTRRKNIKTSTRFFFLVSATSYFIEAMNAMKKFNNIRIDATNTDRVRRDFTFEKTAQKEIIFKSYALQMMSILLVMPVSLFE